MNRLYGRCAVGFCFLLFLGVSQYKPSDMKLGGEGKTTVNITQCITSFHSSLLTGLGHGGLNLPIIHSGRDANPL